MRPKAALLVVYLALGAACGGNAALRSAGTSSSSGGSLSSSGGSSPSGRGTSQAATASTTSGSGAGALDASLGSDATGSPSIDAAASADAASATDAGAQPYKGVALLEPNTCPDLQTLGLSWYYNWTTTTGCKGVEFVPMIWGHPGENIPKEIQQIVSAGEKTVLGFNEPDNDAGQADIGVTQALALWPQLTVPGLRVGSPATSANGNGQAWFTQFMSGATQQGLRIDFVALHWYGWSAGSCDNANALETYLKWAEQFKLPMWLTEWGCLNQSDPTAATVKTFYDDAIVMFKKHPLLERYGWFLSRASDNNALISSSTVTPTPLGSDYAAAPSTH
jgi:hypothetical protein